MKQGKLTVTEKDGRVDWKDVAITIDDQSLTLEELATAWRTAHSELAAAKQRVKVLERATSMSQQGLAEVHLRNEARLAKRITELETQLAETERRKEGLRDCADYAAQCLKDMERQLAEARERERKLFEACKFAHALLDSKSRNADRIEEQLRVAMQSQASAEEPQKK